MTIGLKDMMGKTEQSKNQKYGGDNIKHAKIFIFIKILQSKQKQYEEFKTL